MKRLDKMEKLIEALGAAEALEALTRAMSEDEFQDYYNFIMRVYDLNGELEGEF